MSRSHARRERRLRSLTYQMITKHPAATAVTTSSTPIAIYGHKLVRVFFQCDHHPDYTARARTLWYRDNLSRPLSRSASVRYTWNRVTIHRSCWWTSKIGQRAVRNQDSADERKWMECWRTSGELVSPRPRLHLKQNSWRGYVIRDIDTLTILYDLVHNHMVTTMISFLIDSWSTLEPKTTTS